MKPSRVVENLLCMAHGMATDPYRFIAYDTSGRSDHRPRIRVSRALLEMARVERERER